MPLETFFPTHIYTAALQRSGSRKLNRQLLAESRQLRADDTAGRRWSAKNYPAGYTSYGTAHRLQRLSPTFAALEQKLQVHIDAFAAAVDWDLVGRRLAMTDCWVNIMEQHATHGLHLHPAATLSGTYYVQVPAGAPGIKFEDPRLDRFMAAPPRRARARAANRAWVTLPAVAGRLVLFESWLRHEVVTHVGKGERVSISFNYNWF